MWLLNCFKCSWLQIPLREKQFIKIFKTIQDMLAVNNKLWIGKMWKQQRFILKLKKFTVKKKTFSCEFSKMLIIMVLFKIVLHCLNYRFAVNYYIHDCNALRVWTDFSRYWKLSEEVYKTLSHWRVL